jgi:uncharacterized OB-fold protein
MNNPSATPTPRPAYDKVLPTIEPGTQPFWDALRQRRLIYQKCRGCGNTFAPYQPVCPSCWSEDLEDRQSTGQGSIYTFSIVHRAPMPAFRPDLPYAVAIVQLDEGFYLTTNIVDCPVQDIQIDLPVRVEYVDVTADITLAKFRPRDSV